MLRARPLLLLLVGLACLALVAQAFQQPIRVAAAARQARCQRHQQHGGRIVRMQGQQQGEEEKGAVSRSEVLRGTLAAQFAAGAFLFGSAQRPAAALAAVVDDEPEAAAPAAAAETTPANKPVKTAYDYQVPYDGERVPLSKFRGKAVIVCNPKSDDPEALNQMPALAYLNQKYFKDGLKIWCFTTEQGTFETDEDRIIRIKYYSQYGYGQYPNAVTFDKMDIVGKRADPFYKYLCLTLRNPNKIARITLNFEKFLLNAEGRPIRRYPRKYSGYDMEEDVKAVLAGQPLPAPSPKLIKAWRDAFVEAERSEYAFKKGLNYYEVTPVNTDVRDLP